MTQTSRARASQGGETSSRARFLERFAGWLVPLALFLSTFGVYAATAETDEIVNDAYTASVGAWRIASTGAPWLDGVDLTGLGGGAGDLRVLWLREADNGHVVTHRTGGPILAGVPFYWLLNQSDDPEDFSLAVGGIAASFVAALAVLFMYLTMRARLSVPLSLVGAATFAFATPTWSVSADGLWTHPVTQVGIAGAAFAMSRGRWWLAGAFLGAGMWGRQHVAVIAAVVGLGQAWSTRSLRPVVRVAIPSTLALLAIVVWNRLNFGGWSVGGAYRNVGGSAAEGYGDSWGDEALNVLGFLVSADKGLLVWTPLVLFMLPALVRSWRELPRWSLWLALGGLAYTIVQLRVNYFAGGEGFYGYRHGLELLTCLAPALAFSVPRLSRNDRLVVPVVIGLQVAVISVGSAFQPTYVPISRVWIDNGFVVALTESPLAVGAWMAGCLAVGVIAAIHLDRRDTSPAPATVG